MIEVTDTLQSAIIYKKSEDLRIISFLFCNPLELWVVAFLTEKWGCFKLLSVSVRFQGFFYGVSYWKLSWKSLNYKREPSCWGSIRVSVWQSWQWNQNIHQCNWYAKGVLSVHGHECSSCLARTNVVTGHSGSHCSVFINVQHHRINPSTEF